MKNLYQKIKSENKVKRLFILGCLILLSFTVAAQGDIKPNELVKAAVPESELAGIAANDLNGILYLNYLTEEAWYILDVPNEKMASVEGYPYLYRKDRKTKEVSEIQLREEDLPTFNLLMWDYKISATPNYYKIANSHKVLVIKSREEITTGINRFKNQ